MDKLLEIATTVLIFLLANTLGDYYKSDLIELHLLNGDIEYIKVNQDDGYSCPKICSAKHFHAVSISYDKKNDTNYNLSYNNEDKIYLNGINVINAFEIVEKKKNNKNNSLINERNQLNIKNFIKKYH